MTVDKLQKTIIEDLQKLFEEKRYQNSYGEYVPLNFFEQNTPFAQTEEEPDPIPYIVVRVGDGSCKIGQAQIVSTTLTIGLCKNDPKNDGHLDVLNVIQKIYERYEKNPMLAHKYMFLNDEQHSFEWALQDEESYPYFFGAIAMDFACAAIRKEDKFS